MKSEVCTSRQGQRTPGAKWSDKKGCTVTFDGFEKLGPYKGALRVIEVLYSV